jgi:hypothetical protein
MKLTLLTLLVVLNTLFNTIHAELNYKLSEALLKGLVNLKISGVKSDSISSSTHYGPCIRMELTSATSSVMNIELDYGYKFEPTDTGVQSMMVTKSMMVKLEPRQKKNCRVYAMCIQAHDRGPTEQIVFKLGKRASGYLLSAAEFINRKNYQNSTAQNAVWCITDNYDLFSVSDSDTSMMYDLRRLVAHVKGIPFSKIYEPDRIPIVSTPEPIRTPRIITTYTGSLHYSLSRTSKIMVAMFDESNHMKTVYVNNENQREGDYTYNYKLSGEEVGNQKLFLRMFRDGQLEQEIKVVPNN